MSPVKSSPKALFKLVFLVTFLQNIKLMNAIKQVLTSYVEDL